MSAGYVVVFIVLIPNGKQIGSSVGKSGDGITVSIGLFGSVYNT